MGDYYEILGVSKDCSDNELKKAYHKIALKNHPDKNKSNPDALELFKKATEAYETLSNDGKRKRYDLYGNTDSITGNINHMSIFEELFGGNIFFDGFFSQKMFSRDMNMISNSYESTSVVINGNEKITRKTVHTPSGVRTTEFKEIINHEAPTNIDILKNMSRLGLHSRGGF
jgi:DnaJ-class molecular chaperone